MKNKVHTVRVLGMLAATAAIVAGCWDHSPCDEGQIYYQDQCMTPPPAATAPVADAGAGEASAAASGFGKACGSASDCSADAPICGAPYFAYCTQISCNTGEAHAGACPAGFQCQTPAGSPSSVCLKP